MDNISNHHFAHKMHVVHIGDKMRKGTIKIIKCPNIEACDRLVEKGERKERERPKITWRRIISNNLQVLDINANYLVCNRVERQKKIYLYR